MPLFMYGSPFQPDMDRAFLAECAWNGHRRGCACCSKVGLAPASLVNLCDEGLKLLAAASSAWKVAAAVLCVERVNALRGD